jgi:hypothetical protein
MGLRSSGSHSNHHPQIRRGKLRNSCWIVLSNLWAGKQIQLRTARPALTAPAEPALPGDPKRRRSKRPKSIARSAGLILKRITDLYARVRLRVGDLTKGAEVPSYASQIGSPCFMTAGCRRAAAVTATRQGTLVTSAVSACRSKTRDSQAHNATAAASGMSALQGASQHRWTSRVQLGHRE